MAIEEQVNNLSRSVKDFANCVDSLHGEMFLKMLDGWTPRDILAHLIGWNQYTIKGCEQIRKGNLPFYFIDPGEDYCKVNAVLVRKYSSRDKTRLLDELESSADELKSFLCLIDPLEWDHDYGVRYQGFTITIRNTVDALIEDFINHRQQIEQWVTKKEC